MELSIIWEGSWEYLWSLMKNWGNVRNSIGWIYKIVREDVRNGLIILGWER